MDCKWIASQNCVFRRFCQKITYIIMINVPVMVFFLYFKYHMQKNSTCTLQAERDSGQSRRISRTLQDIIAGQKLS